MPITRFFVSSCSASNQRSAGPCDPSGLLLRPPHGQMVLRRLSEQYERFEMLKPFSSRRGRSKTAYPRIKERNRIFPVPFLYTHLKPPRSEEGVRGRCPRAGFGAATPTSPAPPTSSRYRFSLTTFSIYAFCSSVRDGNGARQPPTSRPCTLRICLMEGKSEQETSACMMLLARRCSCWASS